MSDTTMTLRELRTVLNNIPTSWPGQAARIACLDVAITERNRLEANWKLAVDREMAAIEQRDRQAAESERLKRLCQAVYRITDTVPELNMGNYDHEEVTQLNDGMVDIHILLHDQLAALATTSDGAGTEEPEVKT